MKPNGSQGGNEVLPDPRAARFHLWLDIGVLTSIALALTLLYFFWADFGWGVRHVTSAIFHGDLEGLKN